MKRKSFCAFTITHSRTVKQVQLTRFRAPRHLEAGHMAHTTAKVGTGHRAPTCCETSGAGSPDMVFGFFDVEGEDGCFTSESSGSEGSTCDRLVSRDVDDDDDDADEGRESSGNGEEERAFWETQRQLLEATLCRTSPLESRIRIAAKAAVAEMNAAAGEFCNCGGAPAAATSTGGCRKCLMREVCNRLQDAGFNCSICRTKWRRSPEIPSGEHSFVDVVDIASSKGGVVTRVIIEVSFRAEFEMARASEEYRRLILRLPELFVGKVARLQALIKILCSAAKRSMKQNKMHMGPWRKQRYVQAKWLSPGCEKTNATGATTAAYSCSGGSEPRKPSKKTSMLTVALLARLSNLGNEPAAVA